MKGCINLTFHIVMSITPLILGLQMLILVIFGTYALDIRPILLFLT